MIRCPRCPNGAVIAENAGAGPGVASTQQPQQQQHSATVRPERGAYLDLSLTLPMLPTALVCRNCGWKRDAAGFSVGGMPFADSSSEIVPLPISQLPLHPGLEASGRNDDAIQRLLRMPTGVLCTACSGPSPRCEEEELKAAIQSFKNLPQPPNNVESRASFWAFAGSKNFAGRPVILDFYYVVTRNIEGTNAERDDKVDLCLGCGRPCVARYIAPRAPPARANPTGPLSGDWAHKQREREREWRQTHPRRILPDRDHATGLPVPGTGGFDYGDGVVSEAPAGYTGNDDDYMDDNQPDDDDAQQPDENGTVIRRLDDSQDAAAVNTAANNAANVRRIGGGGGNNNNNNNNDATGMPLAHNHFTGAELEERARQVAGGGGIGDIDGARVALVADPNAIKEATTARLVSLQQARILEEARKAIVTLLEEWMGPPSTWPRTQAQIDKNPGHQELWLLASFIWLLASSSPSKTGAVFEWSIAREFLIKIFKTDLGQRALDSLFPRDPRDPDILVWTERWIGTHQRAGALIFARRLHECVNLTVPDQLSGILRDAISVSSRSRALRILGQPKPSPVAVAKEQSPDGAAAAAAASSPQPSQQQQQQFGDTRVVRVPVSWVTSHAWKAMQSRAFRFAFWILRAAQVDLRAEKHAVYLVQVRLMLRFAGDATAISEGSFFSLICGLPYNNEETRDYVVLDGRDEQLRPVLGLALDRLIRISRGANWPEPNAAWGTSLTYTCAPSSANDQARELIKRLPQLETIQTVKFIACHEDIKALGGGGAAGGAGAAQK